MKQPPKNCIACGIEGMPCIWNDIGILNCENCGLAWRDSFDVPVNYYTELNLEKPDVGEDKAFSRISNAKDRLASIKKFLPKDGVCDIGCGDGSFLSVLKDAGFKECWGIEPSIYACSIGLKNGLDIVKGDIFELQKNKNRKKINAVSIFHVIEHLSDPAEELSIIKEALNPGGFLIIETPDSNASIQKITGHKNALIYREHLFYWNEKSLRVILEKLGFRIITVKHRSFDWKNAPIRVSLMRLGLLDEPFVDLGNQERKTSEDIGSKNNGKKANDNFFWKLVRNTLAYLVHLLGRDDYIFVVAERA